MEMTAKELTQFMNNPEQPFAKDEENVLIRQAQSGDLDARAALIQNCLEMNVYLTIMLISKLDIIPKHEKMNMEVMNTLLMAGKVGTDLAIEDYIVGGGAEFKQHCQRYIQEALEYRVCELAIA